MRISQTNPCMVNKYSDACREYSLAVGEALMSKPPADDPSLLYLATVGLWWIWAFMFIMLLGLVAAARSDLKDLKNADLRNGAHIRAPRDADDFETVSAEWVRRSGVDARRTPKGPDGGLDVVGPNYAAQCKFHPSKKVGAPAIQQLAGAAAQAGKTEMAFFHYGPGYTAAAVTAARQLGVTLWVFDTRRVQFQSIGFEDHRRRHEAHVRKKHPAPALPAEQNREAQYEALRQWEEQARARDEYLRARDEL